VNAITPAVDDCRSERIESMSASRPLRPALYIRVANADSADDMRVQRQREAVLSTARERGWPEPAIYTDTGPSGWQRPGSALARQAAGISSGQRDAVITADLDRISRTPAGRAAFTAHCASHRAPIETADAPGRDPRAAAIRAALTDD